MQTLINPVEKLKTRLNTLFEKNKNLILHNDDDVYYKNVINGLVTILDYNEHQAKEKMMEVHNNNKGVIYSCSENEAKILKEKLESYNLTISIE